MQSSIRKWGNSQAIRIPKAVLEEAALQENDRVEIRAEDGRIVIAKCDPPKNRLAALLEGFEGEYIFEEFGWGGPIGSEVG